MLKLEERETSLRSSMFQIREEFTADVDINSLNIVFDFISVSHQYL